MMLLRLLAIALAVVCLPHGLAPAQGTPLAITVEGADFEPLPIAMTGFEATDGTLAGQAAEIGQVVGADLANSGLFRLIDRAAYPTQAPEFDRVPQFAGWNVINAAALVMGRVAPADGGRIAVQFRLFDVAAEVQLEGTQFTGFADEWRRIAHKVADAIYTRLTGEGPYFDSRIVFVDETGPKGNRTKQLAVMDQDGANYRTIPGTAGLTLTPRFSPNHATALYVSYDTGEPQIFLIDVDTGQRRRLGNLPGMTFAPRFMPSGEEVVFSEAEGGNTDIFAMDLNGGGVRRLTSSPAIDTAPSPSPDGTRIVFESDRGGRQQLYVMPSSGGSAQRISFGSGSYGTPVWSPRGDRIAFTKIVGGRFHIGVMRTDGTDERLLSASFLEEGPTWSPNGRVIMFYRESPGENGRPELMSIDISGRNLRRVPTPNAASDPAWSPLRP